MDLLLAKKAAEMSGKSTFADSASGGNSMGTTAWAIISLLCLVFAMWHAYNANKCEKQGSKLIMALVLSFLFPKLATVYYAMKYKAMPWGIDKNTRLIEKYHAARSGDWDVNKCANWSKSLGVDISKVVPVLEGSRSIEGPPRVEVVEGGRNNMFGGWDA